MEQLYEKYQNIQLFAIKYRKYILLDDSFENYETFKSKMQIFEYVLHKFQNPNFPDKVIDLYLFKHDSKFISSTTNFKKILDRYNKDHTIIMITKEELNVYRKKSIKQYKNINLKNYLHKHFIMELNKGPLCSVHTILTPDETKAVCYDIMAHGHKLAAIFESDPQNIWIGGEINDLIKIESYSEITGKAIIYRIVTPTSGKIIQNPNTVVVKKDAVVEKPSVNENDDASDTDLVEEDNEDYVDDYVEDVAESDGE